MRASITAPLPAGIEKTSAVVPQGALSRILFGNKNLTKEQLRAIRQYVSKSGFEKLDPSKGFIRGALLGAGKSPLKTVSSRFRQGGLLGRGGVLRGELAFNPRFFQSSKRIRRGKGTLQDYGRVAMHGGGGALSAGLLLGFPGVAAYNALSGPPTGTEGSDLGMELGTSLGYLVGGPLGLIGSVGSGMLGGMAGSSAGSTFDEEPTVPKARVLSQTIALPQSQNYSQYTSAGLAPLPLENEYRYELGPEYSNYGLALGQY